MRFNPNGSISEADIADLERQIGFSLPNDYRHFLQQTNGGHFAGGYPEAVAETIGGICCDSLFGRKMPNALDLDFWFREMKDEIPASSLLIGKDPSGAFFLLVCELDSLGVYCYDHSYNYPESSDQENAFFVSESFSKFAKQVGIQI
jgi:hypothetical protein